MKPYKTGYKLKENKEYIVKIMSKVTPSPENGYVDWKVMQFVVSNREHQKLSNDYEPITFQDRDGNEVNVGSGDVVWIKK